MKKQLIAVAALTGLLLAACTDDKKSSSPADTTVAPAKSFDLSTVKVDDAAKACAAGKTLKSGALTIATGDPAYPPYVNDDAHPESGDGFESSVAMAVAKSMGFDASAVTWVRTSFDTAVAGSDNNFDFNLQQFTINADRQKVVSFSDPYYVANQAVLGYTDGPGKNVKKLSDLKKLKLGAASGTTSLQFITDVIKPDTAPFAFNSNADAKAALDAKTIDAIITDLPTGVYITNVEIEGTTVFGQFAVDAGEWGLLFVKDNPLVACANLALKSLTASGALTAITAAYMGDYASAPLLPKD